MPIGTFGAEETFAADESFVTNSDSLDVVSADASDASDLAAENEIIVVYEKNTSLVMGSEALDDESENGNSESEVTDESANDDVVSDDSEATGVNSETSIADSLDGICEIEDAEKLTDDTAGDGASELITVDENVDEAIEELNDTEGVAFAQKNYTYELLEEAQTNSSTGMTTLSSSYSNDKYGNLQYYLGKWDSSFSSNCGANLYEAWDLVQNPSPVTVAIIDTGCQMDHGDLNANILTDLAYNAVTGKTGNTALADSIGHGTHVAGIAGAVTNNNIGISGASGNYAQILPINVFYGEYANTASIIEAYHYLDKLIASGDVENLHVINMSLGGYDAEDDDLALCNYIDYMRKKDVLTVCAGGNGDEAGNAYGTDVMIFPGDYDACLCVTSLDKAGNNSYFSDYNQYKDISAPGEYIFSTYSNSDSSYKYYTNSGNYGYKSGTSMSTPLVSGVAALLWANDSDLTVDQVVASIEETAHKVNTSKYNRTGKTGSAGAIDAAAALEYASENYADSNTESRINISEDGDIKLATTTYKYDGTEHEPSLTVTYNGEELEADVDYIARYQSNIYPETAMVIVSGIGNYKGTMSATFSIGKASISKATVTLSPKSYVYNGKYQFPDVTVKAFGETLKWNKDFKVDASIGGTLVGEYKILLTGKGNFTDTLQTSYKIVPKGTSISKLTRGKKSFKVKWAAQKTQTSGYQLRYSLNSSMADVKSVTVSSNATTSKTIKNLKAKKTYYVQVRTYKTVNGVKYYSSWSKAKSIKTK